MFLKRGHLSYLLSFLCDQFFDQIFFIHVIIIWFSFDLVHGFLDVGIFLYVQVLLLYLLVETIEPVFDAVLCSPREQFYYFRPSVANLLSLLKDLEVFLRGEGLAVDFRVQEVVPPLAALLAIPVCVKLGIQSVRNFIPLPSPLSGYYFKKHVIFLLLPLGFSDGAFVALVEFVLALSFIPPRHELGYVLPVRTREVVRLNTPLISVGLDSPCQQLRFFFCPISFGGMLPCLLLGHKPRIDLVHFLLGDDVHFLAFGGLFDLPKLRGKGIIIHGHVPRVIAH
mmetsp:Transcript_613/g.663  ORF Transcript_613/g.663 Transcript_613/m.663 type:complete len:282 (-) Transcript_613:260-1105(-)